MLCTQGQVYRTFCLKMLLIFHFILLYTAIHKQRVMKMDNVVPKPPQTVFLSFSSRLMSSAKGSKMAGLLFVRTSTVAAHVSSTCKLALTMPHLSHHHITEVSHWPIKLRQLVVSRSCPQAVLTVLSKEPIQTVDTQKKNSIYIFFKSSKLVN